MHAMLGLYVYMCVHVSVCMHVCVCVCMYVCIISISVNMYEHVEMDKRGRSDLMYETVKEVTVNKRRNCKSNAIRDSDGVLLTEPEEIQRRWKEYTETL